MSKFNALDWIERCKTCTHAKFIKTYQTVGCTINGDCEYEQSSGLLSIDYSQETTKKDKAKAGKECARCHKFVTFDKMAPIKRAGKIYYTYCRNCRRKMSREYGRRSYARKKAERERAND